MNLNKHMEFFNPLDIDKSIHIIGVGAVGSTVAEMLVRLGVENLTLYDMDIVSPHNITNQMFLYDQIGSPKTDALAWLLKDINPDIKISLHKDGYIKQPLSGHVFLCVDNIDLRRKIATDNMYNPQIDSMYDFRMLLTSAQHYAANWKDPDMVQTFIESMQFSHEEAKEATPVSACGTTLSVTPVVRILASYGITNFINFLREGKLKKIILFDAFSFIVDAF